MLIMSTEAKLLHLVFLYFKATQYRDYCLHFTDYKTEAPVHQIAKPEESTLSSALEWLISRV